MDSIIYCQWLFCCQIKAVRQEKDIKHQKTIQLLSNNISEIWLSMMLFKQQNTIVTINNYHTASYRQQFLSCLHLPKSVGKVAIMSIPWSKIFTAVSCSCLTVNNFFDFHEEYLGMIMLSTTLSKPYSFYMTKICIVSCSLDLSLGRLPKIWINMLAFWYNGNGLYISVYGTI